MNVPLRVVDRTSGELQEHTTATMEAEIISLRDELRGVTRDLRSWMRRYAELERDRDVEARESDLWAPAVILFKQWQRETGHPRCQWTTARFELIKPYLSRHGIELCEKAIKGHAYDPWTTQRKNGTERRFDSWELLWRDEAHFEEAVNKCPRS